ncbi:hypothetical protein P692DRAFT_20881968 [Suillus brevipes Sb2]|nr:hypothetical protein P692DRAFT_20881968 [Suillus brevipes Sb2]
MYDIGGFSLVLSATYTGSSIYQDSYRERIPVGQKLGCVGGTWFDIYSDTTFLDRPCGAYCPTVWRHAAHHDEYLSLDWDKSYGIRRLLRDADTEWRLNEYCVNALCDFRLDATVENLPLPATEMPADEFDVADTLDVIYAHAPHYHKLYRGLLYATACSRASLVEVPLQIGYWVYQRNRCLDIASRGRYRKTYDSVPNTTIAVDDVYTLFFKNNEQFAPPNILLDLVVPEIRKSVGLTGNVLVVKMKRQDHLEIVDMCEGDLFLMNFILRSVLNKSHVCPLD